MRDVLANVKPSAGSGKVEEWMKKDRKWAFWNFSVLGAGLSITKGWKQEG
jgi:hypothetical protein